MLLMLLIGWIVLLPALVVAGLYVGSSVLGRRRAVRAVYEDLLFADEQDSDSGVTEVTPEAITGVPRTTAADSSDAHSTPAVGARY